MPIPRRKSRPPHQRSVSRQVKEAIRRMAQTPAEADVLRFARFQRKRPAMQPALAIKSLVGCGVLAASGSTVTALFSEIGNRSNTFTATVKGWRFSIAMRCSSCTDFCPLGAGSFSRLRSGCARYLHQIIGPKRGAHRFAWRCISQHRLAEIGSVTRQRDRAWKQRRAPRRG